MELTLKTHEITPIGEFRVAILLSILYLWGIYQFGFYHFLPLLPTCG
jgi:hypothetical protein